MLFAPPACYAIIIQGRSHLSLYPVGAGVFSGAVVALVASAVVALLVAIGYIADIKYDPILLAQDRFNDFTGLYQNVLYDSLEHRSLVFKIVAAGLERPYSELRTPIDDLSYLRPVIAVLYLFIAACLFMAVVRRRKGVVFGAVCLAAVIATAANVLLFAVYLHSAFDDSDCAQNLYQLGFDSFGESALKKLAANVQTSPAVKDNPTWNISVQAEGRTLNYVYRFKQPFDTAVRWLCEAAPKGRAQVSLLASQ